MRPRTEAERRALRRMPEYRTAMACGDARAHLRWVGPYEEMRLTAWLKHHGFTLGEMAEMFAVSPATIRHRLRRWRKLVEGTSADGQSAVASSSADIEEGPPLP